MKKVLSIVLSIAMVVCLMPSMAFAATATTQASVRYTDISGEKCEGAVNVLSALGVVDGYSDGTYRPAQTVTRAEMAKLIITALGLADYASATTSQFTDMTVSKWAIPYIEYAADLGIVNGYGNGKFGPADTVTYEQALTMVVRSLGYTDSAKEMNGTWPAVYVQKARALGLLEDIENGGKTSTNRGDAAILLYNALPVGQVYVDNDGATQNKKGTNGAATTCMMDTLNQGGTSAYGILTDTDADDSLYNVRSYVGAVGKIFKDKDGKVLALGDVKTVFLTGDYDYKEKEFEADDVTYTLRDDAFKTISTGGTISTLSDVAKTGITSFANGKVASTLTPGAIGDDVTIACKVSGKTITEVYSVSVWSGEKYYIAKAADLTNMKNNHKLQGYEFPENDNGDIDYTAFVLEGVDSVEDIAVDNILKVYISGKEITKLSVGTKTVEGTVTKLVTGKDKTDSSEGTKWEITIDGTKYKAAQKGASPVKGISSDTVSANDTAKLYLTADGKIAKIEKVEGTSDYAVVIDLGFDSEKATFGDKYDYTYKLRLLTADGSKTDYVVDEDYVDDLADGKEGTTGKAIVSDKTAGWYTGTGALTSGSIIKYAVNSDGEIDSITKQTVVTGKSGKISKTGYYSGLKIADDATIFTCDTEDNSFATTEKDDWDVTDRASILDSDETVAEYVVKDSRIVAMIVKKDISGSDYLYGVYIDQSKIKDGDYEYEINMLVGGEKVSYKMEKNEDAEGKAFAKSNVYRLQPGADGTLKSSKVWNVSDGKNPLSGGTNVLLGYKTGSANGIEIENNAINDVTRPDGTIRTVSYDDNVVVYVYTEKDNKFVLGDISDIENADKETLVTLYDADTDKEGDGVASLIIVDEKAVGVAQNLVNAAAVTINAGDGLDNLWIKDHNESLAKSTALDPVEKNILTGNYGMVTATSGDASYSDPYYTVTINLTHKLLSMVTTSASVKVGVDTQAPGVSGAAIATDTSESAFKLELTGDNNIETISKEAIIISNSGIKVSEAAITGGALYITLAAVEAGGDVYSLWNHGDTITLAAGAIKDLAGNGNEQKVVWTAKRLRPAFKTTSPKRVSDTAFQFELTDASDMVLACKDSEAASMIELADGFGTTVSKVEVSGSAVIVTFAADPASGNGKTITFKEGLVKSESSNLGNEKSEAINMITVATTPNITVKYRGQGTASGPKYYTVEPNWTAPKDGNNGTMYFVLRSAQDSEITAGAVISGSGSLTKMSCVRGNNGSSKSNSMIWYTEENTEPTGYYVYAVFVDYQGNVGSVVSGQVPNQKESL